jgi:WD40 repeat protein
MAQASVAAYSGHDGPVLAVAVSSNGMMVVSGGMDNTVRVWYPESGPHVVVLTGHTGAVHSVAIAPNGGYIISGSADGTVRVWSIEDENCIAVFQECGSPVFAVAFSPDGGRFVTGSEDRLVRIWSMDHLSCIGILEGHTGAVRAVTVTSDGAVISGSDDTTVRVWNASTCRCVHTLTGHTKEVTAVAFTDNRDLVISGSLDCHSRMWTRKLGHYQIKLKHEYMVRCIAVSHDGEYVACGDSSGSLRLWNINTALFDVVLYADEARSNSINSVAISPTRIYLARQDGTVQSVPWPYGQSTKHPSATRPPATRIDIRAEVAKMTWLPADSPLRQSLTHKDLWPEMLNLSTDEWATHYGVTDHLHRQRILRFLRLAIGT